MRFSVIIPVYFSHTTLELCIEGLRKQVFSDFEVIFVDSTPDDRCVRIIEKYPCMHIVRSSTRLWMHTARNLGVRKSQGTIVVFTDPDCVPKPDWLLQLDQSFRQGHNVVGGAIACYPAGYREMVAHIVKFWAWLPNGALRFFDKSPYNSIPTVNLAMMRDAFDAVGGFSERYLSADTLMSYHLQEKGFRLYFNADAVVEHIHEETLKFLLKQRYLRGKDFGATRTSLKSWTKWKSVMLLAGLWFLPWRNFVWKMQVCLTRKCFKDFVLAAPLVFCCDVAWIVGQGVACWRHIIGKQLAGITNHGA
jgi:GT2 family glycosyltransferase